MFVHLREWVPPEGGLFVSLRMVSRGTLALRSVEHCMGTGGCAGCVYPPRVYFVCLMCSPPFNGSSDWTCSRWRIGLIYRACPSRQIARTTHVDPCRFVPHKHHDTGFEVWCSCAVRALVRVRCCHRHRVSFLVPFFPCTDGFRPLSGGELGEFRSTLVLNSPQPGARPAARAAPCGRS